MEFGNLVVNRFDFLLYQGHSKVIKIYTFGLDLVGSYSIRSVVCKHNHLVPTY